MLVAEGALDAAVDAELELWDYAAVQLVVEEAVKAGYYTAPNGTNFPKLQVLTVKGLLDGTERARYPDLSAGGHTFKKAAVDQGTADQGKLFK